MTDAELDALRAEAARLGRLVFVEEYRRLQAARPDLSAWAIDALTYMHRTCPESSDACYSGPGYPAPCVFCGRVYDD